MAQRLDALLLARVALFPTDLTGLYRFAFDHAARRFPPLAPAFLGLIAVGAAGWRESDFRAVLPDLNRWDRCQTAVVERTRSIAADRDRTARSPAAARPEGWSAPQAARARAGEARGPPPVAKIKERDGRGTSQ
jgi:hypothetical protein